MGRGEEGDKIYQKKATFSVQSAKAANKIKNLKSCRESRPVCRRGRQRGAVTMALPIFPLSGGPTGLAKPVRGLQSTPAPFPPGSYCACVEKGAGEEGAGVLVQITSSERTKSAEAGFGHNQTWLCAFTKTPLFLLVRHLQRHWSERQRPGSAPSCACFRSRNENGQL